MDIMATINRDLITVDHLSNLTINHHLSINNLHQTITTVVVAVVSRTMAVSSISAPHIIDTT
ncbi:hypothetical protein TYRP_023419 [Tyrophagus putrescentiae]|nr:hypothetical protein TYRP_023419 [Tyrophagus putrescentiae]